MGKVTLHLPAQWMTKAFPYSYSFADFFPLLAGLGAYHISTFRSKSLPKTILLSIEYSKSSQVQVLRSRRSKTVI